MSESVHADGFLVIGSSIEQAASIIAIFILEQILIIRHDKIHFVKGVCTLNRIKDGTS